MSKLPESLTIRQLMWMELPGDLTMGDVRTTTKSLEAVRMLQSVSSGEVRVYFRYKPSPGQLESVADLDVPDEMLLSVFRDLCRRDLARVVVDDGEGGIWVTPERPRVLT